MIVQKKRIFSLLVVTINKHVMVVLKFLVPHSSARQLYLLLCLLAACPNWNDHKHAGAHALSRRSAHNGPIHVLSVRPQTALSEFVAGT